MTLIYLLPLRVVPYHRNHRNHRQILHTVIDPSFVYYPVYPSKSIRHIKIKLSSRKAPEFSPYNNIRKSQTIISGVLSLNMTPEFFLRHLGQLRLKFVMLQLDTLKEK
ncbi:hypothetical protein RIR_jg32143.t1 [Rhizophagus irregularis DAOM 181602=DAOM 197198]|uniref:Uncharacterized protein n=1 Tax=Rhizophagus irregularis (strain DAOM 181602 / DAOM 197198 / MUCL 43194) TaxID=747089 RepID=U9TTM0_RHIID|nr:hypothetical protein RIR_jg32143.t1 [Rhizophagus irregularis DAOM 181602=DAOM 197198]